MSDPVTNAEVEDVLSSIRRLVSDDKRPMQAQKAAPANDRLVLTPALRVAELPDDSVDLDTLEEEILHDTASYADGATDEIIFEDPAHDYAADPYNFSDDSDADGEGDAHSVSSRVHDAVDREKTAQDDLASVNDDDVISFELDAQKPVKDAEPANPATLSAKIEALEAAIGNIADTWEPDTPGSDEYSGTDAPAMVWEDDVERDAMGARFDDNVVAKDTDKDTADADASSVEAAKTAREPQPTAAVSEPSATSDDTDDAEDGVLTSGPDDQMIDEEALRDLISDIVRAELQGALGERITRNVRKLVRREIHRALTAQELE